MIGLVPFNFLIQAPKIYQMRERNMLFGPESSE